MRIFSSSLTPEIAEQIAKRSEDGDGVLAIIKDMGLPEDTLDWLKENYHGRMVDAKKVQVSRRPADFGKAKNDV